MNDNHHHEAILSMRRWTNLGKKRKDGQNRARKWYMRMCPYSTSSRIPRVFPSLIFFFRLEQVCNGLEFKKGHQEKNEKSNRTPYFL